MCRARPAAPTATASPRSHIERAGARRVVGGRHHCRNLFACHRACGRGTGRSGIDCCWRYCGGGVHAARGCVGVGIPGGGGGCPCRRNGRGRRGRPWSDCAGGARPRGLWLGVAVPQCSDDVVTLVCDGAYGRAAEAAQPIINSQLHARMLELGDSADRGRRQVPVASQSGSIEGAVRQALGAVASWIGNDLHAAHDGVTPHILITLPRAPAQLLHTDAGLHTREGSTTSSLSVYVSLEERTGVYVLSSVYGGAGGGGECTTVPKPV